MLVFVNFLSLTSRVDDLALKEKCSIYWEKFIFSQHLELFRHEIIRGNFWKTCKGNFVGAILFLLTIFCFSFVLPAKQRYCFQKHFRLLWTMVIDRLSLIWSHLHRIERKKSFTLAKKPFKMLWLGLNCY